MELYLVGVCPKVDPILNAVKEIARLEYKTAPDLYQHSLSTLSSFAKTFAVERNRKFDSAASGLFGWARLGWDRNKLPTQTQKLHACSKNIKGNM